MEYSKFKTLLRRMIVVPMLVTTSLAGFLLWETFDLNRATQWSDAVQIGDRRGGDHACRT